MNSINNNREGDIYTEDGEIIDNGDHIYIGDEYKDLIDNIFKSGLRNEDLHHTNFDNRKLGLANIISNYLEKRRY